MNSDVIFCFRRLTEIAIEQNTCIAVTELKHAIVHLEAAKTLSGSTSVLDYGPARTCIEQLIVILKTEPQPAPEK